MIIRLPTYITYPNFRGAGYAVLEKNGNLYLGTNRGLFCTSYPVEFTEEPVSLDLLPELSGQVWNLEEVNDDIFCLQDKGVFVIDRNHRIKKIPNIRGALTAFKHATDSQKYWTGTYHGLYLLQNDQGDWRVIKQIEDLTEWMKNAAFESPEVLWVRIANEGFLRVELDTVQYTPKK